MAAWFVQHLQMGNACVIQRLLTKRFLLMAFVMELAVLYCRATVQNYDWIGVRDYRIAKLTR